MTDFLIEYFTRTVFAGGYSGIAFLMTLESMVAPVPSEAIMPFAGFLWYLDKMNFWPIVFFSTLGSLVGSLISYCLGLYGGRPLIKKYGKFLLLNEHHLAVTENFFHKYGGKAIFISRFIPLVRHLISLPAGMGEMKLIKFLIYTVLGAGLWNAFLTGLGYYLGSQWHEIRRYGEIIDLILAWLIIGLIAYFIYQRKKKKLA